MLLHCNWLMSDGKDGESSSQHRNLVYKQLGCLLGCVNLGKAVKREGQHWWDLTLVDVVHKNQKVTRTVCRCSKGSAVHFQASGNRAIQFSRLLEQSAHRTNL